MASKINKKYGADIKGILSITEGKIEFEVEDTPKPVDLANFISDFNGKEIKATFVYGEEL